MPVITVERRNESPINFDHSSKTQQLPNEYIVTIAAYFCKRLCGTRGSLQGKKNGLKWPDMSR